MFNITSGKGFRITFPSGWSISVQFGPGNYCANANRHDFAKEIAYMKGEVAHCESPDAEIAIINEESGEFLRIFEDTVLGSVKPVEVADVMAVLARKVPDFDEIRDILRS